jgi:hypothetical protein
LTHTAFALRTQQWEKGTLLEGNKSQQKLLLHQPGIFGYGRMSLQIASLE